MGAANLAAGITQGFPIGASGSRTAVNDQMGVRSQLSGLLAAGVIALVLLFLTAPMEYLPKATLGAVIVAAGIGIVNPDAWRGLARTSRVEVAIAAITMAGVIAVGVLEALLVAVALSIVDVVRRSAIPHDAVLGWDERMGRYADVSVHRRAARPWPTSTPPAGALGDLIRSFQADGVTFVFARIKTPMRHTLEEAGIVELVGRDHLSPAVQAAASGQVHPPR